MFDLTSQRNGILINIALKSKRDNISTKTVSNLKRLLSRTAMRLDNLNLLASPAIPVILKKPVILLIKLSCGIIRNINKFRLLLPTARKSNKSQAENHT